MLCPILLLAMIPAVVSQTQNLTYLTSVLQALQNQTNLTTFATLLGGVNSTTNGSRLLSLLDTGNFALFAPHNAAFAAVPNTTANDTALVTDIISYHVVSGNFSKSISTFPNVTIGRTELNASSFVQLEDDKNQVLAWTKDLNGTIRILNQPIDTTILSTISYQNLEINIIDHVLTIPGNLSTVTIAANNLSGLAAVLQQSAIPSFINGSEQNVSLSTALASSSGVKGYTLFAPNDAALVTNQQALIGMQTNASALQAVLQNHIINGSTVYSPSLASGSPNFTSAAGETLTFTTNTTGTFVSNGGLSAQIVRTDLLVENGVVHVINGVLVDLAIDPTTRVLRENF